MNPTASQNQNVYCTGEPGQVPRRDREKTDSHEEMYGDDERKMHAEVQEQAFVRQNTQVSSNHSSNHQKVKSKIK